jgi:hypothetical protein
MLAAHLVASVLDRALAEVQSQSLPVYTFALYHDHESGAISVCVDTEDNSSRSVASSNRFNMKYFMKAIADKDLNAASLWQANVGRSLSLGDFALVNAARTPLGDVEPDQAFYLAMVESLVAIQRRVAAFSPSPERLVFACSGAEAEVAYVWALPSDA